MMRTSRLVGLMILALCTEHVLGCVVQTEPGLEGKSGPPGPPGSKGPPGEVTAAELNTLVAQLQNQITALEERTTALESANGAYQAQLDALKAQLSDPDCPPGYGIEAKPLVVGNQLSVLCKKGNDEIVKVGTGSAAFWIDRYESSVWEHPDGTGNAYFVSSDNDLGISGAFPKNGQWTGVPPVYALSVASVPPSAFITYFQANEACLASGKRLAPENEWILAARGTPDPSNPSDGAGGTCNTNSGVRRDTGGASQCVSAWGAEDMNGNLNEMTAAWYAGVSSGPDIPSQHWPDPAYGMDATHNISSNVADYAGDNTSHVVGLPSIAIHGGQYNSGTDNGVFFLALNVAPTSWNSKLGFRCIVRRS